jgi:hypothetical protein
MTARKQFNLVVCKDGFTMSVQASEGNYCTPRNNAGPWSEVEVGMPSKYDYWLNEYAEDPSRPTETVYGWVPADKIRLCIDSHGGMVAGELPELVGTFELQ